MSRVTGLSISKSNRIGVEMVSQAATPFPSALVVYQLRLGESAPDAAALVDGDLADVCANEVAGGMMAPPHNDASLTSGVSDGEPVLSTPGTDGSAQM